MRQQTPISRLLLICLFGFLFIQSTLGQFKKRSTTRALIIGISDYQDELIPDLKYAHSDATLFADYLMTPSGGKVSSENITLLTNEEATCGNVHQALDALLDQSEKKDKIYIFFSGHGDVESIDHKEQGHLLLYNTSASVYQLCSVQIEHLKKVVHKLSNDIGANVILITDACRSGALAGESIQGSQATAGAMYQSFSNEIKIMSCQPNEYSHEGEEWNGGAFTHFLVNGLTGLADTNGDEIVTLGEVGSFLDFEVSQAVLPNEQTPVISGDKKTNLSFVDLEKIKIFAKGGSTIDDNNTESNKKSVSYFKDQFNVALQEKRYIGDNSALEIFEEMEAEQSMKPLLRGLKGDLVSALQDDVQESIKAYLKADNDELKERISKKGEKYTLYPKYMNAAADLLGQEHYLYQQMIAKKLYFEAVNLRLQGDNKKEDKLPLYEEALEHIQEALIYEDRAAYIFNELGLILYRLGDDNCEELYQRAIKLSPTWAMPYSNLSYFLLKKNREEEAKAFSEKAIALHAGIAQPYYNLSEIAKRNDNLDLAISYSKKALKYINTANSLNYIGYLHLNNNQSDSAKIYFQQGLAIDTTNAVINDNLGNIYMNEQKPKQAIQCFLRATKFSPNEASFWNNLGFAYQQDNNFDAAKKSYLRSIAIDPNFENVRINYGILLYLQGEYLNASLEFDYVSKHINPENYWPYFNSACCHAKIGQPKESIAYIKTLVSLGFSDIELLTTSEDLIPLQEMAEFQAIISQIKKK